MPKGEGDPGWAVALAAPQLCLMLGALESQGISPQNHFQEPQRAAPAEHHGASDPSLLQLHEAAGGNGDKPRLHGPSSPLGLLGCQQGCLLFFASLAGVCARSCSEAAQCGSAAGRRRPPAPRAQAAFSGQDTGVLGTQLPSWRVLSRAVLCPGFPAVEPG